MYIEDSDVQTVVEKIKHIPRQEGEMFLILVAEHSTTDLTILMDALNENQIPFAGGVFPGIIFGEEKYDTGIVAVVIPIVNQPTVIEDLDKSDFGLKLPQLDLNNHQYTALILVDGLTDFISLLLDKLEQRLGNKVNYIGGGAGSLTFLKKPCVFNNAGIYQDAAVIIWTKATSQLGVRHGWQHFLGPHIATRTDGPIVFEIDGNSAFQFYRQAIEKRTGKVFSRDNFFDIAKEYPLGIYHPGVDRIVRDPITFTDDGGLVCVGEVPEQSMVYILRGNKESLISNARRATLESITNVENATHHFIVDCISRVLYLGDDFSKELSAVSESLNHNGAKLFGVLSLGEIATYGTGRVEFFNKTFVLGSLSSIE